MGLTSNPEAVVDQFGRVRGLEGLRIADTSILPAAPMRGPAATAVLIGEVVADSIRGDLSAPESGREPPGVADEQTGTQGSPPGTCLEYRCSPRANIRATGPHLHSDRVGCLAQLRYGAVGCIHLAVVQLACINKR